MAGRWQQSEEVGVLLLLFSCIEIGAVLLVVIREFNDVLDIPSESKGKSTLEIERLFFHLINA